MSRRQDIGPQSTWLPLFKCWASRTRFFEVERPFRNEFWVGNSPPLNKRRNHRHLTNICWSILYIMICFRCGDSFWNWWWIMIIITLFNFFYWTIGHPQSDSGESRDPLLNSNFNFSCSAIHRLQYTGRVTDEMHVMDVSICRDKFNLDVISKLQSFFSAVGHYGNTPVRNDSRINWIRFEIVIVWYDNLRDFTIVNGVEALDSRGFQEKNRHRRCTASEERWKCSPGFLTKTIVPEWGFHVV